MSKWKGLMIVFFKQCIEEAIDDISSIDNQSIDKRFVFVDDFLELCLGDEVFGGGGHVDRGEEDEGRMLNVDGLTSNVEGRSFGRLCIYA